MNVVLAAISLLAVAQPETVCAELAPDHEWIHLTGEETDDRSIVSLGSHDSPPKRTDCSEALFTESGSDVVTEWQWSVVAALIVSSAGTVERFKVLYRPRLRVVVDEPIATALKLWRYEPLRRLGEPVAFCDIVVFTKKRGDRSSSVCGEVP